MPNAKRRTYNQLMSSGFPITWTVVQAALYGSLLLAEHVKEYAADHLGVYDDTRADLVLQLYDAETNPSHEMAVFLDELAARESPSIEEANCAERLCNLIFLKNWLERYPTNPPSEALYDCMDGLITPWFDLPYPATFTIQFCVTASNYNIAHDYCSIMMGYRQFNSAEFEERARFHYARRLTALNGWIRAEEAALGVRWP